MNGNVSRLYFSSTHNFISCQPGDKMYHVVFLHYRSHVAKFGNLIYAKITINTIAQSRPNLRTGRTAWEGILAKKRLL